MPKSRQKLNKIFHSKLDEGTMALIRNGLPTYLQQLADEQAEPQQMSIELLQEFVQFLKSKSQKFRGVNLYEMKTNQTGTAQLYDYMRKRINKTDQERPVTPARVKAQTNKPKTPPNPTTLLRSHHKDTQMGGEDAARVGGEHIPGHNEERDMKFYKNKNVQHSDNT